MRRENDEGAIWASLRNKEVGDVADEDSLFDEGQPVLLNMVLDQLVQRIEELEAKVEG